MRKLRFDDEEEEVREPLTTEESVSAAEIISNDSFERLRARNKRRSTEELILVVGLVFFLVAVLVFLCGYLFFKAKDIRIEGNSLYDSASILREAGITPEDNLFSVNESVLQAKLTVTFPYIRKITVTRKLPTTIIIRVEEDSPLFYTEILGDYFLLSSSLRVLERAESAEDFTTDMQGLLPVKIPQIKRAIVGNELVFPRDATYRYMTDLLSALGGTPFYGRIDTVDVSEKFNIRLYLNDAKICVSIGGTEDLEAKLTFLSKILATQCEEDTVAAIHLKKAETAYITKSNRDYSDQLLK